MSAIQAYTTAKKQEAEAKAAADKQRSQGGLAGLLSALVGGGVGFLTGGPLGALTGALPGLGQMVGGGAQQPAQDVQSAYQKYMNWKKQQEQPSATGTDITRTTFGGFNPNGSMFS
jgi:hypothetical protein